VMPPGIVKPSNGAANTSGNAPDDPTVVVIVATFVSCLISVTAVTNVDPSYRAAEIGVPPTRRVLGVNPVPLMRTLMAAVVPGTILFEPTVIVGVARMFRVVVAVLPAASVTVTVSAVEVSVDDTTKPRFAGKLPARFDVVAVPTGITVAGVTLVSYQLICVPFMLRVSAEFAAKPKPATVTCAPGLTADSGFSFG